MRALAVAALLLCWVLPAAAGPDVDRPLILVAKPSAGGPLYDRTVLVVAPLGGSQHVGFIVNRPTEITLGELFPEHAAWQKVVDPVYVGGPLQTELIFALVQRPQSPGGKSLRVMPGLYAAYETAVVERLIEAQPQHTRLVAGLVAWRPGELQSEIDQGLWIALKADAELVMRKPDGLWDELVLRWRQRWNAV